MATHLALLDEVLRRGGWIKGREVDHTRYVDLGSCGEKNLHGAAISFFKEFGGLVLSHSTTGPIRPIARTLDLRQRININAPRPLALDNLQPTSTDFIPIFATGAFPITAFFMARDGRVVAVVDGPPGEATVFGPWADAREALAAYLLDGRHGSLPVAIAPTPEAKDNSSVAAPEWAVGAAEGFDDLPVR